MPSVFGMKPEAPKSMQRRITVGSSLAETTTTGTLGYCARRYIRPEKPRTPGMLEIEQDEIDLAAALEQARRPPRRCRLRAISTWLNKPVTASRNAPRNSG